MADALLELSNVETTYGRSQVLFGVSFAIPAGQMVTLMGRNGMGKTTTVRSIMGLTPARSGSIRFAGREIAALPSYRIAQCGIGLVPEGRRIFPNLTVRENLIATAARADRPGAWTLGTHYRWINPIAFCWIIFIAILFILPTTPTAIPWHSGFNWDVVNYAPITVGSVLLIVGIWWLASAHKWFKGPIVQGNEAELERIESELEPVTPSPAPSSA